MRIEARANLLETQKALDEQPGANEQHERESNLANQQETSRARPAMSFAGAPALLQRAGDIQPRSLKRRDDAEKDSGKRGNAQRECQDAIINPDVFRPRRPFGDYRHQQIR